MPLDPSRRDPLPSPASSAARRMDDGRRLDWLFAAVIFAATLLAYWPAMHGALIWDDDMHVTRAGLRSLQGLWLIWTDPHATQQYYPLLHSAFWLEHRLWGDRTFGYHLINVLLHATDACLLAVALRRLAVPGAWLAAFVFALHPVCVESVAWISEQKNTLSTAFYLLSALVYFRFDEKRTAGSYALALFFFVLALLTKSVTATLPAALLVVFWWRRGRLSARRDVLPLLPWFVVGAASGLFTAWVEKHFIGAEGAAYALDPLQRGLLAARVIWFYFGKLVWPADLIFIYPHWEIAPAVAWQWLPLIGLAAATAGLWRARKRSPGSLAAFLYFCGSLFPVLGFFNVFPFIYSYVADHFQYVASFGVIAIFSAGVATAFHRAPVGMKRPGWALAGLVLAALGWLTSQQCRMYRDAETVYRTTLDRNPDCWMAHNNLGTILADQGKVAEAEAHYREGMRLKPDHANLYLNLGALWSRNGRGIDAIPEYKKAISLNPKLVKAYRDLGVTLVDLNRSEEAIGYLQQALQIWPNYADAHENLGYALLKLERPAEALAHFQEQLQLEPDNAEAFFNAANALVAMDRIPQAIDYYERALQLNPNYARAYDRLGVALARSGRTTDAISSYEQALHLDPANADAHYNLSVALIRIGKMTEAYDQLKETIRIDPGYAKAHHNLGIMYLQKGQSREAAAEFEQALRLNPADASARQALDQLHSAAQPKP